MVELALMETITRKNVVKLANMSVTSNAEDLREHCICFLFTAAKESIPIDNYKNLDIVIMAELGERSFLSFAAIA